VLELGVSSLRKTFWPTDTDVFQELQKDAFIRKRFEETARGEEEVEMGREREKDRLEMQREGEIQELLDRPRVMDDENTGLVKSPVETVTSPLRTVTGSLTRRKFSVDAGGAGVVDKGRGGQKLRHSVDIAEVLGRK
jgi:phospholipid-translocating ATPase